MKEPTIVKSFPSNRHFDYDDQRKETSTEGKIPGLWNRYFQEQLMHHIPNQQTKETFAFTQTTNQMKLVHINSQLVCPFLH